ncbi:hypothetical protein [Halobacillus mangrovi]|uniref:IDEAL domain-containing protein n=1 Tax=Halobacillus mangrovi TaxID=402384 RepID=A0A1W6A0I3_9BACI|nr:hypothetical protein [Halobacillus mangrovi]ARI75345.1 hypothetical protein HM131_00085 [Halobacillus mangrovi]ARI79068.1 hypothetical protein HM131_20535 [Halobacillus mangrovi]
MEIIGQIISGSYNEMQEEFTLNQVKHLQTTSVLNENQVNQLYEYLEKHKDEVDGQVLSLYDQLLVRLSQEDIHKFLADLERLRDMYE